MATIRYLAYISEKPEALAAFYARYLKTIVHFHVGRSTAPIDAACFQQSIVIDGRQIYDRGQLMLWDDPAVAASVKASAMPVDMTENHVIALT